MNSYQLKSLPNGEMGLSRDGKFQDCPIKGGAFKEVENQFYVSPEATPTIPKTLMYFQQQKCMTSCPLMEVLPDSKKINLYCMSGRTIENVEIIEPIAKPAQKINGETE